MKRVIRCSKDNNLSGEYVKDILKQLPFNAKVVVHTDKQSVMKYDIPYGGFSGKVSEVPWFFSDLDVSSAEMDSNHVVIQVK